LGLNDKEVDKLVDISYHGIERLPRHHVILPRPNLRREAVAEHHLSGNLGSDGGTEDHPRQLEEPSDYVEVPSREDKRDDGSVRDG